MLVTLEKQPTLQEPRRKPWKQRKSLGEVSSARDAPARDRPLLFSKLGNQRAIPIFLKSRTMFFPKVVNAENEFTKDDDRGRQTEQILHQNGRDRVAKRLDDAQARLLADAAASFAKRLTDQTAAPVGEAALRRMIQDLGAGKPNYDSNEPGSG